MTLTLRLNRRVGSARRLARSAAAVAWVSCLPLALVAQVGHLPRTSPYEDFKPGQSLTIAAGLLGVKRDPAGVAPKAGPLLAVRYDIGVGGPAFFFVRYSMAPSERRLLDPAKPAATRLIGTPSVTTHVADLGLDIALTGQKTWHRLIPSLGFGAGVASDFAAADTGLYKFGTRFSFSYGPGVRYLARNGFQVRFDATNYIWQYQYPDKYFVKTSDTTSVLSDTRARSVWRGNWGLSTGLSIPLFR